MVSLPGKCLIRRYLILLGALPLPNLEKWLVMRKHRGSTVAAANHLQPLILSNTLLQHTMSTHSTALNVAGKGAECWRAVYTLPAVHFISAACRLESRYIFWCSAQCKNSISFLQSSLVSEAIITILCLITYPTVAIVA